MTIDEFILEAYSNPAQAVIREDKSSSAAVPNVIISMRVDFMNYHFRISKEDDAYISRQEDYDGFLYAAVPITDSNTVYLLDNLLKSKNIKLTPKV